MKKGFATSAILYTMLLLFMLLLVSILNNLQNKKTILDTLKKDTINALQQDTIMDSILDQITMINTKIVELNTRIANYETNTYTKTEIDNMFQFQPLRVRDVKTEEQLNVALDLCKDSFNHLKSIKEVIQVKENNLSLLGGSWVVETYCADSIYGYQIAKLYHIDRTAPHIMGRTLFDSVWGSWYEM